MGLEGTNLLGDGFKDYVNDQINLRQGLLGANPKSNEIISWQNSKSAYIALATSVNIENSVKRVKVVADGEDFFDADGTYVTGSNNTFEIEWGPTGFNDGYTWSDGSPVTSAADGGNPYATFTTSSNTPETTTVLLADEDGEDRVRLLNLDGDPYDWFGNVLAEGYVLFGGTAYANYGQTTDEFNVSLDSNANAGSLRYGISTSNNDLLGLNAAYGLGNTEMGINAMPGITSFSIKDKNMGSLREASITIRANNKRQFEMIDTLYCRVGYSMFVEWGNSIYISNDVEYNASSFDSKAPSLIPAFLRGKKDNRVISKQPQSFIQLIEDNRKASSGNYDGFFGRVKNFKWSFNKEGYYEINLSLISWGDIIESLQIDGQYGGKSFPGSEGGTLTQQNNSSALASFISIAAQPHGTRIKSYSGTQEEESDYTQTLNYLPQKSTLQAQFEDILVEETSSLDWTSTLIVGGATLIVGVATFGIGAAVIATSAAAGAATGVTAGYLNDTDTTTSSVGSSQASEVSTAINYDRSKTNSAGKVISFHAVFGDGTDHFYYVRFGDILDFIKHNLLLYHGEEFDGINESIIEINTNTEGNWCYSTGFNVSADPSKVAIRAPLPFNTGQLESLAMSSTNEEEDELYNSGDVNLSNAFSSTRMSPEPFNYSGVIEDGVVGNIMNIYFEYKFLLDTLDELRDENTSKVPFYDFINRLLSTANSCLGGVNKLALRIKDDRIIEIYDQNPIYGVDQKNPDGSSIINLYGFNKTQVNLGSDINGSFVTDFSIKSELTNDFSTTVAVGAQAQGSVVGEDATALSKWNFGLVDRYYSEKIDSLRKGGNTETTQERLARIVLQLRGLWLGYSNARHGDRTREEEDIQKTVDVSWYEWSSYDRKDKFIDIDLYPSFPVEKFPLFVKLQKEFFQALISLKVQEEAIEQNKKVASNQIGMIPLNLQITMDGLSGIRIYDNVGVDTRFIPRYYPQSLKWVVKGVSHEIVDNKWYTKLDTIAVPKLPEKFPLQSSLDNLLEKITVAYSFAGTSWTGIDATNEVGFDVVEEDSNYDFAPYTLRGLTSTSTGLANVPSATEKAKMQRLVKEIMNPIAEHFGGEKLRVTSCYRSPQVNTAIGGSSTSQHKKGEAVDFTGIVGTTTPLSEVFKWAAENLNYNQIIWEKGDNNNPQWIHIALGTKKEKLRFLGNGNYKSCNSRGQIV